MQTFDGGDPSHMRQGTDGTTTTSTTVFVEEETCTDAEMAHTTETVGIVAIQTGVAGTDAGDPCEGLGDNSADANGQGVVVEVCTDLTDWHESIDMNDYSRDSVCEILIYTRGTNCKQYCEGQGRSCMHAQDNLGSGCVIDTGGHLRQTTDANGCLQNWNNQICGCSGGSGGTAPPPPPPRPRSSSPPSNLVGGGGGGGGGPCADFNNDGSTDVTDLLSLLAAFGVSGDGDTDGNGSPMSPTF